jgi:hypothetical protein
VVVDVVVLVVPVVVVVAVVVVVQTALSGAEPGVKSVSKPGQKLMERLKLKGTTQISSSSTDDAAAKPLCDVPNSPAQQIKKIRLGCSRRRRRHRPGSRKGSCNG